MTREKGVRENGKRRGGVSLSNVFTVDLITMRRGIYLPSLSSMLSTLCFRVVDALGLSVGRVAGLELCVGIEGVGCRVQGLGFRMQGVGIEPLVIRV